MARPGIWRRWLAWVAILPIAFAQAAAGDDPDAAIAEMRRTLDTLQRQLQSAEVEDAEVADARRRLLEIEQRAGTIVTEQTRLLHGAQARLGELGQPTAGTQEPPDVAARRKGLQQAISEPDARVKLARLIAVESDQLADRASTLARERFQTRLFVRTDSVLSSTFWRDLRRSLERDGARLALALRELGTLFARQTALGWLGLSAMVAAAVAVRRWLGRRLERFVTQQMPQGRVRRSLLALAEALLALLVPGVVATALRLALGPADEDTAWHLLFERAIGAVCFSAFVVGLGRALLMPGRPSWRLLPIPDRVVHGMRRFPLYLGMTVFGGWLLTRLASLVQAGLTTAVAIDVLVALMLGFVMARGVSSRERLQHQAAAHAEPDAPALRQRWHTALIFVMWLLLVGSILGIVMGYVALGGFVVRQTLWASVLMATAWLINAVIGDIASACLAPPQAGEVRRGHRPQLIVLMAGGLRVLVALVAIVLVLSPFGEGPTELLSRTQQLRVGLTIGELQLRPTAVLQAMLVFVLTLAAMRGLQHWLRESFLPTTSMDAGMRSSLLTLLGFVGVVVAVALGLSAVGLALDKVAWIASALTVGIGFGMQAVVSNFVSGLILLAERPVKVGDWVALGGVEGDIRRINVRATEIRMSDRSTLIVPNSEFITKVVRNVTHDDPLGRVQIKLPLPLDTDVERVRTVILEAFAEIDEVLKEPAPGVLLDGIEEDRIIVSATGYVSSPRKAAAARSALLFRVLAALRPPA